MSDDDDLQKARAVLQQIFECVGVRTVVFVDDVFADEGLSDVENAIGLIAQALQLPTGLEALRMALPDIPFHSDEVWKLKLRESWSAFSLETRGKVLSALGEVTPNLSLDKKSPSLLRAFMPEGVETLEFAPEAWQGAKEPVLARATPNEGILCLFDQSIPSSANLPGAFGADLLKSVVDSRGTRRVICALLTHTISEEEEVTAAASLAVTHGLRPEEFLPISKRRLSGAPMAFVDRVKKTSLNYLRDALNDAVSCLAQASEIAAAKQFRALDVDDFEHMVLRSSEDEGVWEAETLFRLFEIFRRTAFQELAFSASNKATLNSSIDLVRALRAIETSTGPNAPSANRRWTVSRLEQYETDTLVNLAHRPLELGDIFETWDCGADGSEFVLKKFVLLAQPCDLMVRKDGERATQSALLVQVTIPELGEAPSLATSFALEHFNPDVDVTAYAKFRSAFYLSADVLDLCVFSIDGRCILDLGQPVVSGLHAPWQKRFSAVTKKFRSHANGLDPILENIDKLGSNKGTVLYLKKALAARITQSSLNIPFSYPSSGLFNFGLRRIGRYRQPGATALLSQYVAFLSRNAAEHDLGK